MRHVCVVAVMLVFAAQAGAAPPPDALVVSTRGELQLLDSSGAVTGTVRGFAPCCAAWSPDGTRFAFLDVSGPRRLLVAAADGSGVREVGVGESVVGSPVWISPSEIAVLRGLAGASPYSLWIVSVDAGPPRLLSMRSDANLPLLLQPGGALLLHTVVEPPGRIRRAVIDIRSGASTILPPVQDAVWSPDGRLLAAATADGIETLQPDGSGRRTVVAGLSSSTMAPVGPLAWSPDGRRIAYTRRRDFPELTSRFGTPVRQEVYTVAVDAGDPVRLTGVSDDELFAGGSYGASAPAWWPGGSRLFFKRSGQEKILIMNDDGSCETPWPGPAAYDYPLWRPGAALAPGRSECSSATVRLRTSLAEVSYRGVLPLTIVVRNDGTRTLRDVRLSLVATRGTLVVLRRECGSGAGLACALGDVEAGRDLVLQAETRFRDAGITRVTASVSYVGGGDVDPDDDTAVVARDVSPCDIVGTWGADRLIGTARREWICARPGWDYIDGRGGNDTIDAGSGVDTVIAGPGRDVVSGGGGGDTIRVRDGERDVVDCGTETDVVFADFRDVLRHCERVHRR